MLLGPYREVLRVPGAVAFVVAGLVARHVITLGDAREMARALAYDLARETYRLGQPAAEPTPAVVD